MNPHLRVDAIVPFLQCPDRRCRRSFVHAETAAPFQGIAKCTRKSCGQRWMAEPLDAGDVRAQLIARVEDVERVDDLMRRMRLPPRIPSRGWLQIPLNSELWSDYMETRHLGAVERQRNLFLRIIDRLRGLGS